MYSLSLELVRGDDVGNGHHLVLVDGIKVLGNVLRAENTRVGVALGKETTRTSVNRLC